MQDAHGHGVLEGFDDGAGWQGRWVHSDAEHYTGTAVVSDDGVLMLPEGNRLYGLSAQLPRPLAIADAGLVLQYEVHYTRGHTCGGSYIKLLSHDELFAAAPSTLTGDTPYSVMFGPDKCGGGPADGTLHTILRQAYTRGRPATSPPACQTPGGGEEGSSAGAGAAPAAPAAPAAAPAAPAAAAAAAAAAAPVARLKALVRGSAPRPAPHDDRLHVYTLVVRPDASFKVLVDGKVASSGSLLDSLSPPLLPPAEIPDPTHIKPEDWEDEETIPDPSDVRPPDWDDRPTLPDGNAQRPKKWLVNEPLQVPKPGALKPPDWDDDEDGEWAPPLIPNPKCVRAERKELGCGEWAPPQVPNRAYRGEWAPRRVRNPAYAGAWVQRSAPNPEHDDDDAPLRGVPDIGAVALELWVGDAGGGYAFDNVYVGTSEARAAALRKARWRPRANAVERASAARSAARAGAAAVARREQAVQLLMRGLPGMFLRQFDPGQALEWAGRRSLVAPALRAMRVVPELAYIVLGSPVFAAFALSTWAKYHDQQRRKEEARKAAEQLRAEAAARRAARVAAGESDGEGEDSESAVFRGSRLWRLW
ncbi:hypothetical protein FOA52_000283 [Chlamydomonas sp. UWO 241]|nr:hypothetical protein FOA52_000283 [Chlamydomonas sp. UWO 241]